MWYVVQTAMAHTAINGYSTSAKTNPAKRKHAPSLKVKLKLKPGDYKSINCNITLNRCADATSLQANSVKKIGSILKSFMSRAFLSF